MLNKKAIAAFAAGATLLSGMALAAPAFVSAPAFAETQENINDTISDLTNKLNDAQGKLDKAKETAAAAKKTEGEKATARDAAYDALASDVKAVVTKADGTFAAGYEFKNNKVIKTQDSSEVAGATAYYTGTAFTDWKKAADDKTKADGEESKAQTDFNQAQAALNAAQNRLHGYTHDLDSAKSKVEDAQKALDEAFGKYLAAHKKATAADNAADKAARALTDYVNSVPEDKREGRAYRAQVKKLGAAKKKAQEAAAKADALEAETETAFNGRSSEGYKADNAVAKYVDAVAAYKIAYKAADKKSVDLSKYADPDDLAYDSDKYDVAYASAGNGGNTGTGEEGKGGEGEGGSGEHHDKNKDKITPEEAKALAEFAVKYVKDAKSDPKTVKALTAALTKVTAAKKAKDAKALVSALKELKALVDPLMKKQPKKSALEQLLDPESVTTTTPFGTNTLFTNYKGLYVDLLAHGLTNVRAYNVLLDKLEYGLHNGGWENVIKNFPEHDLTVENTCGFLASLRTQLRKAVKHYEHVQAAVKDIQVELKADYDEAVAKHRWDDVKVIESKMAQAGALMGAANSNRTRAKALLNSADDHAADLHCDTQAKDVRKAMDKEPNSPFKKSGQKNNAQKPEGQNGQKPNGGAAGRQLGKTGATVALVAVAASVLAGMGAALRKIRH